MVRRLWIALLVGLAMLSAVGVSFAQLRSSASPLIVCNTPCSSDSDCTVSSCSHCGYPGRCVAIK